MADLNKKTIKTLSQLCRIELTEEELSSLYANLKGILDFVEQLHEVDVTDISPYSHVEEQGVGLLREDKEGDLLPRELFLSNAPDQVGGMIRVPPVMKQFQ